jgi:trehalose 6-phosphate synthase
VRKGPGWTQATLHQLLSEQLKGYRLLIVSNREPYSHVRVGTGMKVVQAVGGVVTALDPVMKAAQGTWIAQATGDLDAEASDTSGRVAVPPGSARYTLRRVFLTPEEEDGYYYGFANEGLWPLCHIAFQPPLFRDEHWLAYREVNARFARAVAEEAAGEKTLVFIQDYHFALLPKLVKELLPGAVVFQFWHIPWPSSEVFRICPWKQDLLDGLLANDLLSFHIQNHCNNFLETVDRELESRIDWEDFAVTREGHTTLVRPAPIGVDFEELTREATVPQAREDGHEFRKQYGLEGKKIILSVDRLDYTKGIPQRLSSFDLLLRRHPELAGEVVHVQLGVPSRSRIPAYQRLQDDIEEQVAVINARHGREHWTPILFLREQRDRKDLLPLYCTSEVCAVNSVHDGMNLVAKEYVAARVDRRGALVLSEFAGAARELPQALLVNPYAIGTTADTLYKALVMPEEEQSARMERMRETLKEQNVYRWVGRLLVEAPRLDAARSW